MVIFALVTEFALLTANIYSKFQVDLFYGSRDITNCRNLINSNNDISFSYYIYDLGAVDDDDFVVL